MPERRQLTNLLHTAELPAAVAVRQELGPKAGRLVGRAGDGAAAAEPGDTAQLRLERDAAAVRLVTVHRSKGLGTFVFCPFLWAGSRAAARIPRPIAFMI
jgi:exodeoxyribonuclease V beta subunit